MHIERLSLVLLMVAAFAGCRTSQQAEVRPELQKGAVPLPAQATRNDDRPAQVASPAPAQDAPPAEVPAEEKQKATLYPTVRIDTSLGVLDVQLNAERAPITTINFLEYVDAGFYDGTTFHRIIDKMIQGGTYTPTMKEKTDGLREPIKCESGNGLINRRGTIGMIRTPGVPKSAQAQFYINRVDNYELESLSDGLGFAVFGKIVRGMDVLEAIGSVPVGPHPNYGAGRSPVVPRTPVVIKSIRLQSPLDWDRARELARAASLTQEEMRDQLIEKLEQETGNEAVRLDSGVVYIDIREGQGAMPTPEDSVEVYYRGVLMNETEFESSLNEAKIFAMNNVIEGWKQGLSTMKEGGSRVLFIPPALGFGSGGIPGRIPGDAWLMFEVELILVSPTPPVP